MQKDGDQKNLFLAIGLSILVIIGWQFFYAQPQIERQKQERLAQQASQPSTVPQPGGTVTPAAPGALPQPGAVGTPSVPGAPVVPALNRDAALAASQRLVIETPRLKGSIALKGGRIDDLLLTGYRETIDAKSPNIVLLSPVNAPEPYYAEFGWVAGQGMATALPTADTVWTASAPRLTHEAPVTLSWDNGQGLVFKRQVRWTGITCSRSPTAWRTPPPRP